MELREQHVSYHKKLYKGVRALKTDNSRRIRRMAKELITKSDNGCERFASYMSREMTSGMMVTYRKLAHFLIEKEEAELARLEANAFRSEHIRDLASSIADVILAAAQTLTNARLEDQRDARAEVLRDTVLVRNYFIFIIPYRI